MASQSVLELAVNTGKWDSGLKKAKSALDNFTTASGGLQQALGKDVDKMQKFVQMMGSMESKAKTAKGQMNDYKGTIEQLTMQYNRMTEAQQKTIGQDYLRAIDQLRQKYQAVNQEVQQMNRSLQQTPSTPVGGGFLSGMGGKMSGALQVFAGNMMTKGVGMLAGLASEMGDMVKQGIELARQGEGIRIAFERLGRGDILDGLRKATHGTVTDLELMKAAVKFNDFKLPLDELGTMLAFAQQKAKDTGQSVDYMVDSIVTGLGRKSLMILDNLGLSANEIKEKMKDTGDMTKAVGEIIREQMAKSGDYIETAADRATKANVELTNAMTDLGNTLQPLTDASNSLWNSIEVGALNALNTAVKPLIQALAEAGALGSGARATAGFNRLGGESKVDRMIARLGNGKTAGAYSIYTRQLEEFDKYINHKRFQIAAFGSDNSGIAQSAKQRLQAELDGALKMRAEYVKRAQELHNKVPSSFEPATKSGGATGGGKSGKVSTVKPEEILPVGSVAALNKELSELQKQQSLVTNTVEWNDYKEKIKTVTNQIKELKGELGLEALRGMKGVSVSDGVQLPTRESILKKGDAAIRNFKPQDKPTKQEAKMTDIMSQMTSGIGSMVSGIEQLGFELPQGMKDVLGGIQTVTSILSGISAIVSAIEVISTADTIIPFANGGVVKAAGGYRVPGRTFSGDMVPARLNAGELVLNQAQAGVIANALQDRDFSGGSGMMQPYVDGEKIFLGMNNTSKRMGRGEIVTTSTLRRLGLI